MAAPAGNAAAKTTLPIIAAICCLGTLLFLLAATIVLALIPVYLPQKSVTTASKISNQISTYIPVQDTTGRRKRQSNPISAAADCNGATVDSTEVESKIKPIFRILFAKTKKVKDVINMECDIVSLASGRRRRLTLSKRQGSGTPSIRCKYYIVFPDSCTTSTCQNTYGDSIRSSLQSDSSALSYFQFDSLSLTLNGIKRYIRCRAFALLIVSLIRAAIAAGLLGDSQSLLGPSATTPGVTASVG